MSYSYDRVREAHRHVEADKESRFKEYKLYAHDAPHRNEWIVEAYIGNWVKVGDAEFVGVRDHPDPDRPYHSEVVALKGWQVEVHPDHQRKGLANAMYAFAEKAFGLPIKAGDFQTPAGHAFLSR
jgi:GNAT superfamily N-acetyltransferase